MKAKDNDFQIEVLEKPVISCSDVTALLSDYVDDDILPSLKARIANHVEGCDLCKDEEQGLREVISLASELCDTPPLPAGVSTRLRQALNRRLGLSLPI